LEFVVKRSYRCVKDALDVGVDGGVVDGGQIDCRLPTDLQDDRAMLLLMLRLHGLPAQPAREGGDGNDHGRHDDGPDGER
jgi:hypothetical protein